MSIRMLNPVARSQAETSHQPARIEELQGQRLGLLFNGHVSSVKFWYHLEQLLTALYHPVSVISLRKENTFAPAAAETEIEKLGTAANIVFTGVGA